MIVRPARALTLLSRFQPMAPGDLLLTGTPGGTALKAPRKIAESSPGCCRPPPDGSCSSTGRRATPATCATAMSSPRRSASARRPTRPRHPAQHDYREAAMTTREILPQPESAYQLLLDAARTWPDGIATQWIPAPADPTCCLAWSYAELVGTVTRIANALTALGVRRADAVTLSSVNTSMLYAATLAARAPGSPPRSTPPCPRSGSPVDPPDGIARPGRGRAGAGPAAVAAAARGSPPGGDDRRARRSPRAPAPADCAK